MSEYQWRDLTGNHTEKSNVGCAQQLYIISYSKGDSRAKANRSCRQEWPRYRLVLEINPSQIDMFWQFN